MSATGAEPAGRPAPRAGRWWRPIVLASVAACAACGLIYELALLTLATTVQGGGIDLLVAGHGLDLGAELFAQKAGGLFRILGRSVEQLA